jgi:hypothetical protein
MKGFEGLLRTFSVDKPSKPFSKRQVRGRPIGLSFLLYDRSNSKRGDYTEGNPIPQSKYNRNQKGKPDFPLVIS